MSSTSSIRSRGGLKDPRVDHCYDRGAQLASPSQGNITSRLEAISRLPPSNLNAISYIRDEIDRSFICYPPGSYGHFFLPRDQISRIMTLNRVFSIVQHLSCYQGLTRSELKNTVKDIFKKPRLKLLIVAIMTSNETNFRRLVNDNLGDRCLPLGIDRSSGTEHLRCRVASHDHAFLKNGLRRKDRLDFSQWSYAVSAPFFMKPEKRHVHYILDHNDVLPIVDVRNIESSEAPTFQKANATYGGSQTDQGLNGGYGEVQRVKIHQSHFNFTSHSRNTQIFAMKRLYDSDPESFNKELASLLSVQDEKEKHLIKLLVTFEVLSHPEEENSPATFYFLFPCAEGDLWHFWKLYQSESLRSARCVWMAEQCYQLAKALAHVHNARIKHFKLFEDVQENQQELYGRHGDMKASNILWFRKENILTIADFGLGRLHSEISRSGQNPQMTGNTATYRAPEFDITTHKISRACDIFSLGCLFLEFVTWYLKGYDAVHDEFPNFRLEADIYGFHADTFFRIEDSRQEQERAVLKPQVRAWIDMLRTGPYYTYYIKDFLDLIQNRILEPDSDQRIKSAALEKELDTFYKTCRTDSDYWQTPVRSSRR